MKVSIFGLGYVGAVSAGCLAASGHQVTGVDTSATKVDLINRGESPVPEEGLDQLLRHAVQGGVLRATRNADEAVQATELSLVCVGTPSKPNGQLDLGHIADVSRQIGAAIRNKTERHVVVIRSTVLPGTLRDVVIPLLEETSGKKAGIDIGVGSNPEFLREGTAVDDFFRPPKIVVAAGDEQTLNMIASLYEGLDAPLLRTSVEVAEMLKYTDNAWHALKVAFANEIGSMSKALGVDSYQVMDIFSADTKLNISPQYLRPGFAFGGSCLPKDIRALLHKARSLDVEVPVLGAILPSNSRKIAEAFEMIVARKKRRVGFLGMTFKPGTDDLRESPLLELVERLIGKGFDVRIFDRSINIARLVGANREFLLNAIPHISALLVGTLDEVLEHGQTIVVGHATPEFLAVAHRLQPGQGLVDLVHVNDRERLGAGYEGISW